MRMRSYLSWWMSVLIAGVSYEKGDKKAYIQVFFWQDTQVRPGGSAPFSGTSFLHTMQVGGIIQSVFWHDEQSVAPSALQETQHRGKRRSSASVFILEYDVTYSLFHFIAILSKRESRTTN